MSSYVACAGRCLPWVEVPGSTGRFYVVSSAQKVRHTANRTTPTARGETQRNLRGKCAPGQHFATYFTPLFTLSGGFCSLISVLHPRAACKPVSLRNPLVCCLLSCVVAFYLFTFSSLPSLLQLRFRTSFVSSFFFLCGYCCLLGFCFCCDSVYVQ